MMLLRVLRDVLGEHGNLWCGLGFATPLPVIQLYDDKGDESALHFFAHSG